MPDLHTSQSTSPTFPPHLPRPSQWKFKFHDDLSHGLLPLFQMAHFPSLPPQHWTLALPMSNCCHQEMAPTSALLLAYLDGQRTPASWLETTQEVFSVSATSHVPHHGPLHRQHCDLYTSKQIAAKPQPATTARTLHRIMLESWRFIMPFKTTASKGRPDRDRSRWCQDAQSSTLVLDGNADWLTD